MPYAVLLGLVVLWPMLRLSQLRPEEQRQSSRGPAWVLGEWLCLSLVVQAVVWPLMLNAGWGVVQVLWLDLLFVTWGLVAALVIAVGERVATARARILAMVVCVLLVFGEPAALWLLNAMAGGGSVTWPMSLSPVPVIWRITHEFGAGGFLVAAHVFTFLIVAVVGLAITMLDHGRPAERRG